MAAYASTTAELQAIEGTAATVTDALDIASGVIDSYLALYETPVDFADFDAGDEKTRLQARFERWCLDIAAHVLTATRGGQGEKVVKDYERTIEELERVRAGFVKLPLLTALEAPVLVRKW